MTVLAIVLIVAALELGRRGHRHIRRRRHSSLSVRETVPLGRSSWFTFGHRFKVRHLLAALVLVVAVAVIAVDHAHF